MKEILENWKIELCDRQIVPYPEVSQLEGNENPLMSH